MDLNYIKDLLAQVKSGSINVETAVDRLKKLPFDDLGFAKIDNHRAIRTGVPEVIFCQGKTVSQIIGIVKKISKYHSNILGTRVEPKIFESIKKKIADCCYHEAARIVVFYPRKVERSGKIAVVCAGTSDIPVAEEACVVAETLGNNVSRVYDVGVAGIHRLLYSCREIFDANVAVVAAGMEGALASVVGGLVSCPVIGVPTSIGYGASFGGVAALLSMLNSCASGVSVVNIDNGFGAGYQASLINKMAVGNRGS
ncbi:MAG: 1-(5-phosphoribosyl)-5-amino-4-imidazole-carboxylate carboxylase [Desulfobacteraceae bacterium 4572_123]|nr:MAG: 1-(5-phosphoribosyl)-5-amino-4-imidazole-carboxylate carboxylase [Desulfobacteraceae bacterium 4572_123]